MKLQTYLQQNSISVAAFAKKIGAKSRGTVYRYIRGEQIPGADMMLKIATETDRQVMANDFYDLPAPPASKTNQHQLSG